MASEPDETADALVLRDLTWVKELARRLLGDPDQAADVAHDAWLAARTRPPAHLDGGARAWLATVVQHGVQRLRRSERRRRRREAAVAAAVETQSAGDVVERGALCRELTAVVMQLDEPYRSAILLRYLDGLSTAEVAARQEVSPVAARKRLSRALQLLRERLDHTHAGGFAAFCLAWRGQFGVTSAATASGAGGALFWIMNTKLVLASVAAIAATFLLWQWWPSPEPAPPPIARVDAAAPAGVAGETPRSTAPAPSRAAVADVATLEVVDGAGMPRPDVHVFALTAGSLVGDTRTDAGGRAELPARSTDELLVVEPGTVPLRVRRDGTVAVQRVVYPFGEIVAGHVQWPAGAHQPIVLRLEHDRGGVWAQDLDERVLERLDRLGVGPATLRVELPAGGAFRFDGLAAGWTGALTTDGAWTLRETSGRGCLDDATTLLLLEPEPDLRLELTPPFVVRGRVLAGAVPAAGLMLHVVAPDPRQDAGLRTVISGADGRFTIGVPRPRRGGTWRGELLVSSEQGDNLLQRRLTAEADQTDIDVGDLAVGRALAFVVRGVDGAPLPGAVVRVVTADGSFVAATTDAAGRADVFGVPAQASEATVRAHGHRTAVVALPDQGDVSVQLLAGNGIDVRVLDRRGAPATDLRVRVEAERLPFVLPGQPEPAPRAFALAFPLDAHGRCELSDLVPGLLLRLVVVDEADQEVGRAEVVAPPIARCDEVVIEVAAGAFEVEGRVCDEQGRAVPRARLHAELGDQALTARTDADGRFRLGPLRAPMAGAHVEAGHPAFVTWLRDGIDLRPDVPLDIVLTRGRTLRAHLRQQSGAPALATDVRLVFEHAPTVIGRAVGEGEFVFERAAARSGRLVVRLGGHERSWPIDALATDVDVRLPNLGTLSITCAPEGRGDAGERVCVVVTPVEPPGEVDRRYLPPDPAAEGPAWVLQLPPGRYTLALEARRLGGGRARVRQLGAARPIDVVAGAGLQVALP